MNETYWVLFTGTDPDGTRRTYRKTYTSELDAVRALTAIRIYDNLTLVDHSVNIDPSKFRV